MANLLCSLHLTIPATGQLTRRKVHTSLYTNHSLCTLLALQIRITSYS